MPSRVYFVRCLTNGYIKIGFTNKTPEERLRCFRFVSPVPLEPIGWISGDLRREGELHSRFSDSWSHGEWFRPEPPLLEFIAAEATPWLDPDSEWRARLLAPRPAPAPIPMPVVKAMIEPAEPAEMVRWGRRSKIYYRAVGQEHGEDLTVSEWAARLGTTITAIREWIQGGFEYDLLGYLMKKT
jgi:hypothetical protein